MAPNQKKIPTKKTKRTVKKGAPKKNPTKKIKKTVKKGASKKAIEKQLEKMGKRHEKIAMQNEKLEEKMEEGLEKRCVGCVVRKMDEQVEELKENLEEHVQDDGAHQIKEQLEQLKESLEEHVEDEVAHHFEEQLEKLEEKVEKKHDELKDKMEEGEESSSSSSEESEDEDGEGSTSSSSDEEEYGWLRGKMSGLFGSSTHFGSVHSRQVEIQDLGAEFFFHHLVQVDSENVDSDVTEHLHQAYRLVHLFSALFQSFLSVPNHSTQLQPNLNTGSAGTGPRLKPSGGWRKAPALMVFTSTRVSLPSRSACSFSFSPCFKLSYSSLVYFQFKFQVAGASQRGEGELD